MDDVAALFNDAGVRVLLSKDAKLYYSVALDLFRGALETKLALEVSQPVTESTNVSLLQLSGQQHLYTTPAASEAIRRAAIHLSQLEHYLTPRDENAIDSPSSHASADGMALSPHSLIESTNATTLPLCSYGYKPFLCMFPLLFGENELSPTVVSSVIVYHLGLVHQLIGRHFPKTADFYTIAAALLTNEFHTRDTILLRISLLNNFGVWCFENGDGDSMGVCMEHLTVALDGEEREPDCLIESDIIQNVRQNILWLLTPPDGASPAA